MSRIVKRPGARGTTYQARYRRPDGSEGSQSFKRKIDADRFLKGAEADLLRGTFIDPRDAQMPLDEYAEAWLGMQVFKASTRTATESRLRNHVIPAFSGRPISSLRASDVQAWVGALSAEMAPATVKANFGVLRAVLQAAVEDRMIAFNPCAKVRLPRHDPGPVQPLPRDAVEAIMAELPAHLRVAAALGAGAGLRVSEALGLTIDRVHFLRRSATIDRQQVLLSGEPPTLGPPKTRASNRTVALSEWLVESLSVHIEKHGTGSDGLLIHTVAGEPLRRTRFHDHWRKAARRTAWPDANFHDLRHHYASALIAAGCSVKVVQDQMGHASARETLDTYSHLWPDDSDRARAALDAIWGAPKLRPSSAQLR